MAAQLNGNIIDFYGFLLYINVVRSDEREKLFSGIKRGFLLSII